MPSTLLIGAGLAGLTAARELTKKGHSVTVLDKGRGVGGRLATRRIDQSRNDHGAQYFTAKRPDFQQFTEQLIAEGIAGIWPVITDTDQRLSYIGRDGMSTIAKYLAQSLPVITGERVVRIEKVSSAGQNGWRALSETGNSFEADNLIITIPAPQALTLLHDSQIPPDEVNFAALEAIQYNPCLAVMAVLNKPTGLLAPGYLCPDSGPVAWVADNYQKGISPNQPSVTVQATADFSRTHFDADLPTVGRTLLDALSDYLDPTNILNYQVHRWRYSIAEVRHPEPFLAAQTSAPLLFGGDGFGSGNVEGAYLSGLALAERVGSRQ